MSKRRHVPAGYTPEIECRISTLLFRTFTVCGERQNQNIIVNAVFYSLPNDYSLPLQGGSQKTKESIVFGSIFSGSPCILTLNLTATEFKSAVVLLRFKTYNAKF